MFKFKPYQNYAFPISQNKIQQQLHFTFSGNTFL